MFDDRAETSFLCRHVQDFRAGRRRVRQEVKAPGGRRLIILNTGVKVFLGQRWKVTQTNAQTPLLMRSTELPPLRARQKKRSERTPTKAARLIPKRLR
jgi:hypothetical protein